MPAIITLSIVSATLQTLAMSLVIAREDGRLKRGRGTPMPAWVFIAGRIGNSIVVAVLMLALVSVLGRILYGVPIPWSRAPDLLIVLAVGAASFCCMGIALTALIPSQDAAAPIVNALLLPLYFLSGVFVPDDELPSGVIDFANHFPIRPFFQAIYDAYLPGNGPAWPGTTSRSSRSGASPASCWRSASSAGPRAAAETAPPADLPPFARIASRPRCCTTFSWRSPTLSGAPRSTTRCSRPLAGGATSRRTGRSAGESPSRSSSSPITTILSPVSGCSASPGLGSSRSRPPGRQGVGAGGTSVSEPGETRSYGSGSYSAFLKDPDGYEIEVTIGTD